MTYKFKRILITGGAGCIGLPLTDELVSRGVEVVVFDLQEQIKRLESFIHPQAMKFSGSILDGAALRDAMNGCDGVVHLAAHLGVQRTERNRLRCLDINISGTQKVLDSCAMNGNIKKIVFSSTGSVYGESQIIPTPEDCPMPIQTSLYAASKISCESMIQAYCEGFEFQSWIFRFVSVLGERYTHGHVIDFYSKLKKNPNKLHVLGNGHQQKSYIYIQDCILGMMMGVEKAEVVSSKLLEDENLS